MKHLFFLCFIFTYCSGILFSQTAWEHTNGPPGSGFSLVCSNEKFAFIPEEDFLFRTTDGNYWEKLEHTGPTFLTIFKDTLLHPLYSSTENKMRLQISTDNGDSWTIKDLPDLITSYGDLAMCNHGIYWAQTSKNLLFKSTDLGTTWDTIFHPINFGYDLSVFDEKLYANNLGRIWRTGDGENWEEILTPNDVAKREYIDDFVVKDSNILFTTEKLLFFSNDNGLSWHQYPAYSRNAFDKITLVGNDVYFQYDGSLFRTSNFGNTWDTLSTDLYDLSLINFTGGNGVYLAASYNKGVYRWDEATRRCIESNDGLSKGAIYDLSYGDHKIWAACGNGVFAYDLPSKIWSDKMDLPLSPYEYETVSANEDGWVVTASPYGDSLYISEDQGQVWDTIHTDFYIEHLQLLGDHLFAYSDYGLYLSLDKGVNWDPVPIGYTDGNFVSYNGNYYLQSQNKIYYTLDMGLTWNSISTPINIIKLYSDGDRMYGITADTSNFIDLYISEDAVNWMYAGNGFPDIDSYDFTNFNNPAFFFRDIDHYYAFLGYAGHYISPVDEINWVPLETSQTGVDYLLHDNVVYLGGEGMYTSTILNPFTTEVKYPELNSEKFFSINPNPATDFINIVLNEGIKGKGKFLIFSPDGILVKYKKIINTKNALRIEVSDLPVGLYFLSFKGENVSAIKSFIIQR